MSVRSGVGMRTVSSTVLPWVVLELAAGEAQLRVVARGVEVGGCAGASPQSGQPRRGAHGDARGARRARPSKVDDGAVAPTRRPRARGARGRPASAPATPTTGPDDAGLGAVGRVARRARPRRGSGSRGGRAGPTASAVAVQRTAAACTTGTPASAQASAARKRGREVVGRLDDDVGARARAPPRCPASARPRWSSTATAGRSPAERLGERVELGPAHVRVARRGSAGAGSTSSTRRRRRRASARTPARASARAAGRAEAARRRRGRRAARAHRKYSSRLK